MGACLQSTVDKLLKTANVSLAVGTSSWREQFIEAVTVSAGNQHSNRPHTFFMNDYTAMTTIIATYCYVLATFWMSLWKSRQPTPKSPWTLYLIRPACSASCLDCFCVLVNAPPNLLVFLASFSSMPTTYSN